MWRMSNEDFYNFDLSEDDIKQLYPGNFPRPWCGYNPITRMLIAMRDEYPAYVNGKIPFIK